MGSRACVRACLCVRIIDLGAPRPSPFSWRPGLLTLRGIYFGISRQPGTMVLVYNNCLVSCWRLDHWIINVDEGSSTCRVCHLCMTRYTRGLQELFDNNSPTDRDASPLSQHPCSYSCSYNIHTCYNLVGFLSIRIIYLYNIIKSIINNI